MLSRARLCAALLAVIVAMAVLPAATASATVAKSALCSAYKTQENKETKATAALAKELESGSWTTIKSALLATFNNEAGAEKEFVAYLNGASPKVKSAAATVLKLDGRFKSVIAKSTSLTQFETGITAAEDAPKVKAALNVLAIYTTKLCGTTTTTT